MLHKDEMQIRKPRLKRLFEWGDLQLLILLQLKSGTAHGYELMKLINEQTAGIYEPSPGILDPTLSMFEDQALIVQDAGETSRKVYGMTALGQAFLAENYARVEQIKARLESIDSL